MSDDGRTPDGSRVSDYDYELPAELVAQYPSERREGSRLLVLGADGSLHHRSTPALVDLFAPGDALVLNESAVFPARLLGQKPTGASAEVLLLRPLRREAPSAAPARSRSTVAVDPESSLPGAEAPMPSVWEALVRPGGKLKPGRSVVVGPDLSVEIVDTLESGSRVVRLITDRPVAEALERYGRIPLPPYIDREAEEIDRERYQTVYARTRGSIAAPTAGLHFTEEILAEIEARGVRLAAVTLHVGVGTFRPVEVEDPREHTMHHEWYSISSKAARVVNETRAAGGRVWAVGTTAVRTLESAATSEGLLAAQTGETDLFIRPPYDFRIVDGLVTNFHLPRSTLLMLVAAFAGYHRVMDAYAAAVRERYRFFSYGDAMVIEPARR